ncbi:5-oxoprolinase (ATP-hydrolyzing) [Desulfofarcimen acetoxidans DSM 771]|uniref:5-oxoprolinase (ATP-hydrolyzing) n=1 Tax=Desulfofarcimen acetoxidans (strain ATCC 49208 / DSM 771 / KCTC 5769 / VKM B-1644 / 5575) TaxID=485916 RepID=C8VZB5_DESAS|nr:hydantoinase B/oxoprolinase family protein [Desulfofarcimen acetoxidans]ACV64860.1 5-oxoprolinase (ATP-hydrolyzing) [Desulfofarcimen acetoxidans DSM 771]
MTIDAITLEVLRNSLQSVAEEMGVTLIRTALSPNIKDRRDCSTAVYTPEGELVAQAEHIPLHLGLMPTVVQAVLKRFPLSEMEPGDTIIINDPYVSGSHLPDICLISPVYYLDKPLAIVANLAHHVDVGGAVPGSMSTAAREIFQEGLRIPPVKLMQKNKINRDLLDVLANNVRTSKEFYGDIEAQLTANRVGEIRLKELGARYGLELLNHYMNEIIAYGERRMRAALSALPSGVYSYEDYLEGDGITDQPVKIKVALILEGDSLTVDFGGTDPQAVGPVNAARGVIMACVYYTIKAVADPWLPSSAGIGYPIKVITPAGSLVNPLFPAPVAHANINTAQRVADVILGALAGAVPQKVTAAGTGSMSNFTIGGVNKLNGCYYSYVETYGGGQGAKHNQDGMDGVHVHMTNTRNTPVEVIENNYPLRVEKYGLLTDSGGPGEYRGGTGLVREITVLGAEAVVSVSTERAVFAPWGLSGGLAGRRAGYAIKNSASAEHGANLGGKFTGQVAANTTIVLETAGGGGFGNPLKRDPSKVRQDVLNGLVSFKAARDYYGVVISKSYVVDEESTKLLRDELRRSSP